VPRNSAARTPNCGGSAVIIAQRALENSSSVEAINASGDVKPFPCHLRVRVSLHYDLAGHFWVNRAVVGIRPRLGKRVGEFFVRIQHLGLEHAVGAD
jgi:hypothetical protein